MSDDLTKGVGDIVSGLKDKMVGGLGIGSITDKADHMIDNLKDKAESVLGEKGDELVDGLANKAEDTLQKMTGLNIDLNKDGK